MRFRVLICGSLCPIRAQVGSLPLFVICSSMASTRPRGAWWLPRSGAWLRVAARRCTWRRPAGARPRCGPPSRRPEARARPRSATSRPPCGGDRRGARRLMPRSAHISAMVSLSRSWRLPTSSAPGMTVPVSSRGAPVARPTRPKRPAQPCLHGELLPAVGSGDAGIPRGIASFPAAGCWVGSASRQPIPGQGAREAAVGRLIQAIRASCSGMKPRR